jgi:hypothetical protein
MILNAPVTVEMADGSTMKGVIVGATDDGQLKVSKADGEVKVVDTLQDEAKYAFAGDEGQRWGKEDRQSAKEVETPLSVVDFKDEVSAKIDRVVSEAKAELKIGSARLEKRHTLEGSHKARTGLPSKSVKQDSRNTAHQLKPMESPRKDKAAEQGYGGR